MHFRYRVRMHTDIQNIYRNMRTNVATWDKSVTLLYNLVLQQWSCGGERLLTNCPSEIDAKDRPPRPFLKTKVLHKWRNISCQEYTVVSILLALERTRDKYSCCLSLPSAAQWKAPFSIACQIWSRPYWRWVVFKCVTANNSVLIGTLPWIGTTVLAPEQNAAAYGTFHLSELFAALGIEHSVHVSRPDGRSH